MDVVTFWLVVLAALVLAVGPLLRPAPSIDDVSEAPGAPSDAGVVQEDLRTGKISKAYDATAEEER